MSPAAPGLRGEKILVTGPTSQVAFPLVRHLAGDNEVHGLARFSRGDDRGAMVRRMAAAMEATLDELWQGRQDGLPLAAPRSLLNGSPHFLACLEQGLACTPGWRLEVAHA